MHFVVRTCRTQRCLWNHRKIFEEQGGGGKALQAACIFALPQWARFMRRDIDFCTRYFHNTAPTLNITTTVSQTIQLRNLRPEAGSRPQKGAEHNVPRIRTVFKFLGRNHLFACRLWKWLPLFKFGEPCRPGRYRIIAGAALWLIQCGSEELAL